jgi:hemolysin activation/secretion protein
LKGQYTENPLISNEQFSAGGVDTVRGYLESSALGDNAVLGNLEAHYNLLPLADWKKLNELDLSCFVDFARLRTLEALPNADGEVISYTDLLGAGIGLTASAYKSLDLALFWAAPLKDLDSDDFDDDSKLHFRVNYRF